MARRRRNHNFKIHVDPSCLSEPVDDEPVETKVDDEAEDKVELPKDGDTTSPEETSSATEPAEEEPVEAASLLSQTEPEDETSQHITEPEEASTLNESTAATGPDTGIEDDSQVDASQVVESETSKNDFEGETSFNADPEASHDNDEDETGAESTSLEEPEESNMSPQEDESSQAVPAELSQVQDTTASELEKADESEAAFEDSIHEASHPDDLSDAMPSYNEDISTLDAEEPADSSAVSAPTVRDSIEHDDPQPSVQEQDPPTASSRRTSQRTEELIAAAARGIIAHIDQHTQTRHGSEQAVGDNDESILSTRTDLDNNDESFADDSELDHNDTHTHISRRSSRRDDGGESSSQHEATDEDVFSDKSPRSSVGSYDGGSESGKRTAYEEQHRSSPRTRSPRVSDISQYDREEFIPTTRSTPRPPFRTTSDVRAMQMSSPAASVYGGSPRSPRSAKRSCPTVSRLGTPTGSAQYSPKKGSTPPRFKPIKEAPLVLLHVTLVSLHWAWGDLVNSLETSDLSDEMKVLRDSWRLLQDRIGDTVVERGILLGHPQNDYELLEERLLEALELPLRRRARILECGHYLGPSNEATIMTSEDEESEDELGYDRRKSLNNKRHWCSTCKNEIRCEELGPGRIFRVKVYASNGLMRAGAWAACWKEMERVDVEIEPIVEPSMQDELVRLAALQEERQFTAKEEQEIAREVAQRYEEERAAEEQAALAVRAIEYHPTQQQQQQLTLPPAEETIKLEASPASAMPDVPPPEITEPEVLPLAIEPAQEVPSPKSAPPEEHIDIPRAPPVHATPQYDSPQQDIPPQQHEYVPPPSPRSPSEEAQERRDIRRRQYQGASLPELLLEAAKVLMQDKKNVAIIALSVLVVLFALRTAPQQDPMVAAPAVHEMLNMNTTPQVQVTTTASVQPQQSMVEEAPVTAESQEPLQNPPAVEEARDDAAVSVASVASDKSIELPKSEEAVQESGNLETSLEVLEGPKVVVQQPRQETIPIKEEPVADLEVVPQAKRGNYGVEPAAKSHSPHVGKREKTIKVYETVTKTQIEVETMVETIMVYATESYMQQAEPTPKRLEIGA